MPASLQNLDISLTPNPNSSPAPNENAGGSEERSQNPSGRRRRLVRVLHWCGALKLWRWWHRNQIVILMAHGTMAPNGRSAWEPLRPQLAPEQLERVIQQLSRYYTFITLDDAVDMITGRKSVKPYSMVLTFDDGYRNNLKYAAPILRRHGVPCIIFLPSGLIEKRRPLWVDRLDFAIQKGRVQNRSVHVGMERVVLKGQNRRELAASYRKLRSAARNCHGDGDLLLEMESLAERLEDESGERLATMFEQDDWSALVTWEEVRQAQGPEVQFGSHTVDHVRLGHVSKEETRGQLSRSKTAIERETGNTCQTLAYPDGSFNAETAEIARACGYHAAVTTEEGINKIGADPLTLKRIPFPTALDMADNLFKASGFSFWVSERKRDLRSILAKPHKKAEGLN